MKVCKKTFSFQPNVPSPLASVGTDEQRQCWIMFKKSGVAKLQKVLSAHWQNFKMMLVSEAKDRALTSKYLPCSLPLILQDHLPHQSHHLSGTRKTCFMALFCSGIYCRWWNELSLDIQTATGCCLKTYRFTLSGVFKLTPKKFLD